MRKTETLYRQHQEIMAVAQQLSGKLKPAAVQADAAGVRSLLSEMIGKLKLHLAMEDKSLYPALLEAKDAKVVATCRKFMSEMGGIADVVKKYGETYSSPQALASNPDDFIRDTKGLLAALSERVRREESDLYPMAEKL
jgi:hemerythrin-like domain-containing protein